MDLFYFVFVLPYCLVCVLQPYGHLPRKGCSLGSPICDVFLCFVTFPYGVLDQLWYLIISIPDLCLLSYFHKAHSDKQMSKSCQKPFTNVTIEQKTNVQNGVR